MKHHANRGNEHSTYDGEDTDKGAELESQIEELKELLYALPARFHQGKYQNKVPAIDAQRTRFLRLPTKRRRPDAPNIRPSVHIIYQKKHH